MPAGLADPQRKPNPFERRHVGGLVTRVLDCEADVDHRLRRKIRDAGGTDMLEVEDSNAERATDAAGERVEVRRPLWIRVDDSDRLEGQRPANPLDVGSQVAMPCDLLDGRHLPQATTMPQRAAPRRVLERRGNAGPTGLLPPVQRPRPKPTHNVLSLVGSGQRSADRQCGAHLASVSQPSTSTAVVLSTNLRDESVEESPLPRIVPVSSTIRRVERD
jgi:hypothetical protein